MPCLHKALFVSCDYMSLFSKIIYYTALSFISAFILLTVALILFGLEFQKQEHADLYSEELLIVFIPLAICLTCFKAGFKQNWDKFRKRKFVIKRIIISVVTFILIIIYSFTSMWSSMCLWSTRRILFEKISDRSIKIIERDFGCGATDSSPAQLRFLKSRK
jgi:NhaP-type Na+/H+ or K+/H+ antiporter